MCNEDMDLFKETETKDPNFVPQATRPHVTQ
jgi:hypothetical protein